ncbi:MAG: hypothetical protein JSU93_02010, partial [Methanobacteriota archaeon]
MTKKTQKESVICPTCEHESPAGSEECPKCGEQLSSDSSTETPQHSDEEQEVGESHALDELMSLPGIKRAKAELLHEAGFRNLKDIREAGVEQLANVKGIGQALAQKMIANARGMSKEVPAMEDQNLADWLSGEEEGLSAWLAGEDRPEAHQTEAAVAAEPEIQPDPTIARWLAGEEESIDSWLEDSIDMTRPERRVSKKELLEREAEVSKLRDLLIEKARQIDAGEFDAKALVEEIAEATSQLEAERRRATDLEDELENVKRGSIAVIKFIKKQQEAGIQGENLA